MASLYDNTSKQFGFDVDDDDDDDDVDVEDNDNYNDNDNEASLEFLVYKLSGTSSQSTWLPCEDNFRLLA